MNKTKKALERENRQLTRKYFDLSVLLYQDLTGFMDMGAGDPDKYQKYQKTYTNEVWVYACTYRIANSAAGVPLRLYQIGGKERQEITKHPLLDILRKPNPFMGRYDLMEWTFASMELTGTSYLLLDERGLLTGQPGSIYVLNPANMRVVKDKKEYIKGYKYTVGANYIEFDKDAVIVSRDFNPMDDFYGLGSVAPVSTPIESDTASNTYNRNFFKNSARPDGVLETEKALGQAQYKRLIEQWRQKYGSEQHAHMTVLLEKGLKYKPISTTQKDMDFVELKKITREEILAAFGVPPAMVGIFEYANYANSREQRRIFWEDTMLPKLDKYVDRLNRDLVPRYGDDIELGYEVKDIKPLQADQEQLSATSQRYFSMGIPMNDIIDALELPFEHVAGGDVGYLPLNLMPVGSSTPEAQETETPEKPKPMPEKPEEPVAPAPEKPKKTIKIRISGKKESPQAPAPEQKYRTPYNTEAKKKAKWEAFVKIQGKYESKYEKQLRAYFARQEKEIVKNLNQYKAITIEFVTKDIFQIFGLEPEGTQKKRISIDDILLKRGEEVKELIKISGPIHQAQLLDQARQEYSDMGLPFDFDVDNPRTRAWLKKYGLTKATEVNDYSIDVVRDELVEGVKAGESIEQLAARITDKYEGFQDYRAVRIARTETIGASNQGAIEAYKETGIVEKKGWLATYDGKARAGHEAAGRKYGDKGAIPLDENFVIEAENGGTAEGPAPGQMGEAGEDINCRCSIYPLIKE